MVASAAAANVSDELQKIGISKGAARKMDHVLTQERVMVPNATTQELINTMVERKMRQLVQQSLIASRTAGEAMGAADLVVTVSNSKK